jgi:hypothetical protein
MRLLPQGSEPAETRALSKTTKASGDADSVSGVSACAQLQGDVMLSFTTIISTFSPDL